jgi:5'-nucleotidase
LAANLILDDEPVLQTEQLIPSLVVEIEGRKVGIIGYLTPETKNLAIANRVEFVDEVVAIK